MNAFILQVKEGNEDHQKGLLEKATKGHIDVVRLLLKYGALSDMRDKDGITSSTSQFSFLIFSMLLYWQVL